MRQDASFQSTEFVREIISKTLSHSPENAGFYIMKILIFESLETASVTTYLVLSHKISSLTTMHEFLLCMEVNLICVYLFVQLVKVCMKWPFYLYP